MIFLQTIPLHSVRGHYPCLAELEVNDGNIREAGTVVLFISATHGRVVHCPTQFYSVGQVSETWIPVTDEATWKIIPEIELIIATRI